MADSSDSGEIGDSADSPEERDAQNLPSGHPDNDPGAVDDSDRQQYAVRQLAGDDSSISTSALSQRNPDRIYGSDDDSVPFEPTSESSADESEDKTPVQEGGISVHTGDSVMEALGEDRRYVKVSPVRSESSPERLIQELYGFHRFGNGRKMIFGLEDRLDFIDGLNTFEFLIHKPAGEQKFDFYYGVEPDSDTEQIVTKIASQYPTNFQYEERKLNLGTRFDETPHVCRWGGKEKIRKDWMTLLSRYTEEQVARSPLSDLLETAIKSDDEWIFQALYQPKPDWSRRAESQKMYRKRGANSMPGLMFQDMLDRIFGVSDHELRQRENDNVPLDSIGSSGSSDESQSRYEGSRIEHIDRKSPDSTFDLCLRAATTDEQTARQMTSSFSHLSGPYYEVVGNYLDQNEDEWHKMIQRELSYSIPALPPWKKKPSLTVSPEELANFIAVPSIESLPQAARGASGGAPDAQAPLTSPSEEIFDTFDTGMCIGQAATSIDRERDTNFDDPIDSVQEWHETINARESLHIDATQLKSHSLRAAVTGHGKTVATINDILTAHEELDGPTFVLDKKGGSMCKNYLRSHRYIHGDLDDVEYIKIPEKGKELPGIPFFDIRPLIYQAGRPRETAIQDKIDHYYELLRYILGSDALDRAFVANEVLKGLIQSMFAEKRESFPDRGEGDIGETEKNGGDAFGITELYRTALQFDSFEDEQSIPDHAPKETRAVLKRQFRKSETSFNNTIDAVFNRIEKVQERNFIWRMLDYVPEWDHERGWYAEDENVFDFREFFYSNKVILIDTGDLRDEPATLFSVLFLSHLWTSLKSIQTPSNEDWVANCFIEESAPLVRSKLVHDKLLPEGREFGLSLNLVMQFPEQVLGSNPHQNQGAYKEVLNQVNTKIIGEVEVDDELAESLFHDGLDTNEVKSIISGLPSGQWVAQLPNTKFGQQRPEILSLNSLSLPPGHESGNSTIRPLTSSVREQSRKEYCIGPNDLSDEDLPIVDDDYDPNSDDSEEDTAVADGTGTASEDDPDAQREPEELTRQEKTFLTDVVQYWNRDIDFYTPGLPMDNRHFDRRNVASALIRDGFLEKKVLLDRYTYYWPTDKTLSSFDDLHIAQGRGVGDPNESARHKIMVSLLKRSYEDRGFDVSIYANPKGFEDDSPTFDLVATHPDADVETRVVEVETARKNGVLRKEDFYDDYRKLAQFAIEGSATAVWVVENLDIAHQLLDCLSDKGQLDNSPGKDVQNYTEISKQIEAGPGLDKITGFGVVVNEELAARNNDPISTN